MAWQIAPAHALRLGCGQRRVNSLQGKSPRYHSQTGVVCGSTSRRRLAMVGYILNISCSETEQHQNVY